MNSGPLGQKRGVAFVILIGIVSSRDLLALLGVQDPGGDEGGARAKASEVCSGSSVWIVVGAVSAFVIPSEVGNMYAGDGKPKPVTRLDRALAVPLRDLPRSPAIVWAVKVQGSQPLLGRGGRERGRSTTPAS